MTESLLSALIFAPVAGAILLALLPRQAVQSQRALGMAVALIEFVLSLGVIAGFETGAGRGAGALAIVERIEQRVQRVFETAAARGLTPQDAAQALASQRLATAGARAGATRIVEH